MERNIKYLYNNRSRIKKLLISKNGMFCHKVKRKLTRRIVDSTSFRNKKAIRYGETLLAEAGKVKNISILPANECCGCGSCLNICPFDAIKMEYDSEGFLYPRIDMDKCTNCGLCQKKCPSIHPSYTNKKKPPCYAMWADDYTRSVSSSGGMFSVLAEYVLDQDGFICGAAYNEKNQVEHIMISAPEQMYRLRGSKYVQSDTKYTYKLTKEKLDSGFSVLYSGCPCQIAGLYSYLGKDYEKLITVDLICHGVPAPKTFEKYLKDMHSERIIRHIEFRDKKVFGWSTEMNIYFSDGTKYIERSGRDPYYKAFLPCLGMRPFCSACKYTTMPRQADFSIGDFWGIGKYDKELDDRKGTSLVFVNNKKAADIFKTLDGKMQKYKKMPFNTAKPRNYTIDHPFRAHPNRKRFFELLKKYPFDKAVDYAIENKYDVGIIGLWFGRNYGSMLTYYALYRALENMGLSVLMINNPLSPKIEEEYTRSHPRTFGASRYHISQVYPLSEMKKLNNFCDTFIVGSDQLWNYGLSKPYGQTYFLGFADDNKKKIAYGTSFGKEHYYGPEGQRQLTEKNLKRFDAVSVREEFAIDICKEKFDVDAVQVVDPVFLCNADVYDELLDEVEIREEADYIFAYILDPTEAKGKKLKQLCRELDMKVIVVLNEPPWLWEENKEKLSVEGAVEIEVKREVTVNEWLYYLKNSKYVVTDSFHGSCFSIIYRKQFMGMVNERRGAKRFVSLLGKLGLEKRLVSNPEGIETWKLKSPIYYDNVFQKISFEREISIQWLKNAVFSSKTVTKQSTYSQVDSRYLEEVTENGTN